MLLRVYFVVKRNHEGAQRVAQRIFSFIMDILYLVDIMIVKKYSTLYSFDYSLFYNMCETSVI